MTEIVAGELLPGRSPPGARGGTERMAAELHRRLPRELLAEFQIVHSRPGRLRPDLRRVLVCHDLPHDPAVAHLANGGWERYDKLVFVSDWQLQMYNVHLGVPYGHARVLHNAIEPLSAAPPQADGDVVRLVHHCTPQRGLSILYPVFAALAESDEAVELHVYSSFELHGRKERDAAFEDLFEELRRHPRVHSHGTRPNSEVRERLGAAQVFAYPSIWRETSCIALMEAMSAGLLCVHPNYAALPETSGGLTRMYPWHEDRTEHAETFSRALQGAIRDVRTRAHDGSRQKEYADARYGWEGRVPQWEELLRSLL